MLVNVQEIAGKRS